MANKKIIAVTVILLLEIFLVGVVTGQQNVINLKNGAYSNLLIAIDKTVTEDLNIIDNIKVMWICFKLLIL